MHSLFEDSILLFWIGPYSHPQHPVEVGQGIAGESALRLALRSKGFDQIMKRLYRVMISSSSLGDRVCVLSLNFEEL